MINKIYLHPIRASDYPNCVSSCHVLTIHPPSNKISPYSILKNFSPTLQSENSLNSLQLEAKNLRKKAYAQIRVPHSLMVKLSSNTRDP